MPELWSQRLERQGYHLLAYVLLGAGLWFLTLRLSGADTQMWGLSARAWVVVSWVFAGVFQAWIAFFWRMELYGNKISATLGAAGFRILQVGLVVLAFGRFFPLIPLSMASAGSLPIPRSVSLVLLLASAPPIIWAMHGAAFHLGFTRATGADHFDVAYRSVPLVKRGIYKYVPNAAYVVALLILYHAGLLWHSTLSLVVALVHHVFVWVAYFCTEKPDMRRIHGHGSADPGPATARAR